jgi:hypothetical protein
MLSLICSEPRRSRGTSRHGEIPCYMEGVARQIFDEVALAELDCRLFAY